MPPKVVSPNANKQQTMITANLISYNDEYTARYNIVEQHLLNGNLQHRIMIANFLHNCCLQLSIKEDSIKKMKWWIICPYGFATVPEIIRKQIIETYVNGESLIKKIASAKPDYFTDGKIVFPI